MQNSAEVNVKNFVCRYRGSSVETVLYVLAQLSLGAGYNGDIYRANWCDVFEVGLNQALASWLEKGISIRTIALYLSIAKEFAEFHFEQSMISAEVLCSVKRMRLAGVKEAPLRGDPRRAISNSERDILIKSCLEDLRPNGLRDAALVSVLFGAGINRNQLVALRIEDVNIESGVIFSVNCRFDSVKFYISDWALPHLSRWLDYRLSVGATSRSPLFCRIFKSGKIADKPLTGRGVFHILQERSDLACLDKVVRPSDARFTLGVKLLDEHGLLVGRKALNLAGLTETLYYDLRSDEEVHRLIRKTQ